METFGYLLIGIYVGLTNLNKTWWQGALLAFILAVGLGLIIHGGK